MMKQILTLALTLISMRASASVIVDADNKTVNWVPPYNLELNVTPANISDSQYAILSYHWYVNDDVANNELRDVRKAYPGSAIKESALALIGDGRMSLTIPAAGYQNSAQAYTSATGLFAEGNDVLSKDQYRAILAAKKADPQGFAKLTGSVTTNMQVYAVAESKTLTPAICQSLYGNGKLGDVLASVFSYGAKLARTQAIKNAETEKLFATAINNSCFSLSPVGQISSTADLLKVGLKIALTQDVIVNYKVAQTVSKTVTAPYALVPWSQQ